MSISYRSRVGLERCDAERFADEGAKVVVADINEFALPHA